MMGGLVAGRSLGLTGGNRPTISRATDRERERVPRNRSRSFAGGAMRPSGSAAYDRRERGCGIFQLCFCDQRQRRGQSAAPSADRKSVVSGKSVSVRVALGGRRIFKKKN